MYMHTYRYRPHTDQNTHAYPLSHSFQGNIKNYGQIYKKIKLHNKYFSCKITIFNRQPHTKYQKSVIAIGKNVTLQELLTMDTLMVTPALERPDSVFCSNTVVYLHVFIVTPRLSSSIA